VLPPSLGNVADVTAGGGIDFTGVQPVCRRLSAILTILLKFAAKCVFRVSQKKGALHKLRISIPFRRILPLVGS
jgi:hypothetical protein